MPLHFSDTSPKEVEAVGATMTKGDLAAGIDFLDVNGVHIQILPPPKA